MEHARMELSEATERVLAGHADPAVEQKHLSKVFCPFCHTHILDNMVSTACGHLLHDDCLDQALKVSPVCPAGCGRELPEEAGDARFKPVPQLVTDMMKEVEVKCPQGSCGEQMPHEELRAHVADRCNHTLFRCDGCNKPHERRQAVYHARDCGQIIADCEKQCGAKLQRNEMQHHMRVLCPNRTAKCELCAKEYVFSKADAHFDECTGYTPGVSKVSKLQKLVEAQGADLREQTAQLAELNETTARQQLEMDRREEHARVQLAEQVSRLQQQTQEQTARQGAAVEQQLGELREQTAGLLQRVDEQQEAIEQLERAKALQQRSMEQQREAVQKQLDPEAARGEDCRAGAADDGEDCPAGEDCPGEDQGPGRPAEAGR
eukprot:TRINITY_DN518_c0_g1_i10.p1 TRINITY_DN518_c0_g1~~TRINITY_DN518_c0_g1_i10.p1  ORF type:complete len:377 (+),score=128.47 TRINITY_DN518_c0_g1_i10:96-1226(+)